MRAKLAILSLIAVAGCGNPQKTTEQSNEMIKLITLDPGHFHSALVQKSMYPDVDSVVHVYAPKGEELESHLKLIEQYNTNAENPTHWKEEVYIGDDYFEKMLAS